MGIFSLLPEIESPKGKLSFKEKLKWTLLILVLFFVLGLIPLFGLGQNSLQRFEYLSIILGAKFGSLISLGIGPIVTASIVLQLLVGSKIMKIDLSTHEGKARFQGLQKLLTIFFIVLESIIYVSMGGLAPAAGAIGSTRMFLSFMLIIQLIVGGLIIMLMDEVVSKWGFISGVSLFIAAGVSGQIFIRALSPLASPTNPSMPTGAIPALFKSLSMGDPVTAGLMIAALVSTVVVFAIAVYAQAMKVEIPLSFGRVRGYGMRWPLSFIYTSNIPVILVAALMANVQLLARLFQNWGHPIFGTFIGNTPASGIIAWLWPPNIVAEVIKGSFTLNHFGHAAVYTLFMMVGAVIFSIFWVQTSGMDAKTQAEKILSSGLQIPGFRRDERILQRVLNRYIWPLTVMGALSVGFLAALADVSGALSRGTGILLAVMIIYNLYESIAKQHMMDMYPGLRKFMEE